MTDTASAAATEAPAAAVRVTSPSAVGPEKYRPAMHYTPDRTWLNDPNGLVYYKGTYHLFYQNNPNGNVWGNMSWGHAVSSDLLDWSEQPVAIACDDREEIFSGSVVVDWENTSGFGTSEAPPLVAVYTSAYRPGTPYEGIQAQSLAYSNDDGATWTRYADNPVLNRASAHFRDPKVFRYSDEHDSYWVMAAVEAEDRKVLFYRSRNLLDWAYLSEFGPANAVGGVWECPDLFPLAVDGNPANTKWVLVVNLNPGGVAGGSGGQYFIGDFDGATFTPDSLAEPGGDLRRYQWLDWGRDYYAAVSFSDAPHNRRLMIGWMNNWDYAALIPTSPWCGAMSLPREVRLATVDGVVRLLHEVATEPAPAGPRYDVGPLPITEGIHPLPPEAHGSVQLIEAEFEPGDAAEFGLVVRGGDGEGTRVGYRADAGELVVDRRASGELAFQDLFASCETAPVTLRDGRLRLRIYVDRSSVEVFAQDGLVSITDQIFPNKSSRAVSLYARGGSAALVGLRITPLG